MRQNRLPASISCISQRLHLLRRDILTFHHTASRSSRFHRNHHQMAFQETESHLILRTLNLLRPEVVVVIMTHQTGNTDTDRILGTRDDAIVTLRIVLETENQSGEHLRIHLRQFHRPNLLNHLTGRGRQTTAVAHLKGRFQRNGNRPSRMIVTHIRLVNSCTGQIQTGRNPRLLQVRRRTCLQTRMRSALEFDIFDAPFLTDPTFLIRPTYRSPYRDACWKNST